jgi:hypothetical protein
MLLGKRRYNGSPVSHCILNKDIFLAVCNYLHTRDLVKYYEDGLLDDSYFVNTRNVELEFLIINRINIDYMKFSAILRRNNQLVCDNIRIAIIYDNMHYMLHLLADVNMNDTGSHYNSDDINNEYLMHPLALAVKYNRYEILKILVEYERKTNIIVNIDELFNLACYYGHEKIVKMLLRDYNHAVTQFDFMLAIVHNNTLVVKQILKYCRISDFINHNEYTLYDLLEYMVKNNNKDIIKMCIEDIRTFDPQLFTQFTNELLLAICYSKGDHIDLLNLLVSYIDIFNKEYTIESAFNLACINDNSKIVEYFLFCTDEETDEGLIKDEDLIEHNFIEACAFECENVTNILYNHHDIDLQKLVKYVIHNRTLKHRYRIIETMKKMIRNELNERNVVC